MSINFGPVEKTNLADDLAERIVEMIRSGAYQPGDRLPAIMAMARSFGVGHPTVREALKKLEVIGVVDIKHGAGVYVGKSQDALIVSNPIFGGVASKKILLDLIEARIPIEVTSAGLAAVNATEAHLEEMARLLHNAEENLDNDAVLSKSNLAFHHEIAVASGNTVLTQLLEVLINLFTNEHRMILDIYSYREQDHREHMGILHALRARDAHLAQELMRTHLEGVREVLLRWNPERNPLS